MLVLGLLKVNILTEKRGFKQGAISPNSPSSIIALVAKIVKVYMCLPEIYIWEPSLELAFLRAFSIVFRL